MGFFLIGRGRSDGEIRLISDVLFDDRQMALEELGRLSALPDFPHRDAEVFVVDLATAVPVLLVAAPAAPTAVAEEAPGEVSADEEPAEADAAAEPVEADAESVVADLEQTAGVWEAPAPEVTPEAVEAPIAEAVMEQTPEEPLPLADALKKAAGAMESQGISPPESVGPAVPASWPWEAGEDEAVPEPAAEPEPVAEAVVEQEPYVPSALDDPAVDGDGGLLTAPVSDDEIGLPRPVIMGDYAEDEIPPQPPIADADETDIGEIISEELPADLPVPPVEVAEQTGMTEIDALEADLDDDEMGADLEEIELASTDNLTCDDCVYVTTCPNKEGLEPSSCGNFQWKSV